MSAEDVYNQNATGIFWRQMPSRSLAVGRKGRSQEGHKSRDSIALLQRNGYRQACAISNREGYQASLIPQTFSATARTGHLLPQQQKSMDAVQ
jgi:hypothetical protein